MKYGVAAFAAAFMIFAGFALSGSGHGWVSGVLGCFALAPVSFFAWSNALSSRPSQRIAIAVLATGIILCSLVAFGTAREGLRYLFNYWQFAGIVGILISGVAYLNWALLAFVSTFRVRRANAHGT